MRILLINHFPLEGSGSGIYTRNLAEGLVELGNEVAVIFPEHKNIEYVSFKSIPIIFKNDIDEKANDFPLDLDFNFPCFTSHPRSNKTYYELSDKEIKDYVDAFVKKTKECIEEFKPDVIHCQHLWITPFVASNFDIPYHITAHGTDLKGYKKDSRYHKFAHEGAAGAQSIVTISKQVDGEVKELFDKDCSNRNLILNGYNPNLFRVKDVSRAEVLEKWGIKAKERVVFFAGKLAHFKGVDILLDSAKIYEEKFNGQVTTIIAGNGDRKDDLLRQKDELGLKNVHFLGHIFQDELVDLYNVADLSTVPSRTEPFGLVAIEALACGVPVVGTNQGGLPDFITKDVGLLVAVEDSLALAHGIEKILEDKNKDAMKEVCSKYARDNFSREISIKKVFSLYKI